MSNKKKMKFPHYIIIDNQKIQVINNDKLNSDRMSLSVNTYMYEELDSSFFKKKESLLLISSSSLFTDSFFIPIQARDKVLELVKVKFINLLPVSEEDLYYSYFIDANSFTENTNSGQEDTILVICFAVKKEVVDRVYKPVKNAGNKINYILPLPLLFYIYHKNRQHEGFRRDHNSKELGHNSGALYIDRYFDKIAFTVYHDQGIYFRSCSLDKLNVELSRTIDYLEDYVEITNLCIYIGDSKIKADELLEKEEQPESTQDNSKDGPEDYLFDDQSDTRALKLPVIKDNFEQIIRDLELNKSDVSSLNILSQLPVEKKKKRNKYRFIIYFVIFLIIVVNSVSFYMIYKERENSFISYNEQLLQLEPSLNQLENIETQLDINKEQVESYYQILENKQSYLQYIYVLSNTLPEDVKINHLSFESDRMIILDGSAPSASGVMASLEDSEMFNNLEFLGGIVIEGEYERFRIAGDLSDD